MFEDPLLSHVAIKSDLARSIITALCSQSTDAVLDIAQLGLVNMQGDKCRFIVKPFASGYECLTFWQNSLNLSA